MSLFNDRPTIRREYRSREQGRIAKDTAFERDVRDVSQPDLIDPRWIGGIDLKIGRVTSSMPAVGRFRHKRLRLNRSESRCFHYSGAPSRAACVTLILQLAREPSGTVPPTVLFKDDEYEWRDFSVQLLGKSWSAIQP